MSALSVQHHSGILAGFLNLLRALWTFPVACQNDCDTDQNCDCMRHIIHVQAVIAWWTSTAPDFPTHTRLQRLLEDFKLLGPRSLVVEQGLISGSRSYILVFSMLLEQGHGHLLSRFVDSDIDDRSLADMNERNEQVLRKSLSECGSSIQVDQVINDFQRMRWAYCPLRLGLGMDDNLRGTKVIPPFCQKIRLGHTGGTASLYWIAIQRDLITENALAFALQDSIYADEVYGECYQMVLKSYSGKRRSEFEIEKTAFLYLSSSEQVPIIKFLGSYIHDYGEGKGMSETYNLLLEFGERDLYETWADETNVPPVRAEEILQSWKSLFEVAKAIRHVHNLEIQRGKSLPWRFHGWHADIKPDNILAVRGRLKLADFGFSSFAPAVERRDDSEPTELIKGYTDTYGAPEVFRMNQPGGTLSGVSQTIDTWSFGCVLSVAATWIVLGYQGVRQYEKLRQLSPVNDKGNIVLDRFHDGIDVLPEVEKWHNFLSGHLRMSDTTTQLVLDLIETKLLRADPAARYNMEELCDKFQEISAWAEHKIKSLRKHSRHTDALVARALLDVETLAEMQRSSERNLNLSQRSFVHTKPLEPVTKQAQNKDLIRNKPLGQTAHRRQMLDTMLEEPPIIEGDDMPDASGIHNGAITDSPTESTLPMDLQFHGRKIKPRNPQLQASDLSQIANSQTHYGASNDFSQFEHCADTHGLHSGSTSRDVPLVQTPIPNHQTRGARYDPPNQIESVHEMPLKSSPNIGDTKHSIPNPASALTNTPLQGLKILSDPPLSVYGQYGHVTPTNSEKLPFDVYDLPYDICRQRKILEQETPKGVRARLKGKFGLEVRKPDSDLAPIFSVARDLVLVIDNGATMFRHFPIATFVAETLARKAAGLDRDGIDVFFTVDGDLHNRKALVGDNGRQQLRAALVEATPDNNDHDDHKESQTDMLETFRRIAEGWRTKGKPASTLLVLTDGLWKDTNKTEFDKAIIKVAQDATQATSRRTGNRSFSIQFIRFGDEGYERLRELDDVLCSRNMVRDIVDHCSWRTSVDKMIKGSIEGFHDQDDNDEKDMMYHYQDLVALFKSYNDLHHVQERSSTLLSPLSPSPSLARTFSLVSNSSNREKHRSMLEPSPRRGSSHRKMFSQ